MREVQVAEERGTKPRRGSAKRRAAAVGCISAAAVATAHAASASFTGLTTIDQSVSTASLYLTVPSYSSAPVGGVDSLAANRMQLAVTDLYPVNPLRERVIDVQIAGTISDVSSLTVTASADSPSALIAQAGDNGVGMIVDRCSTGWTENLSNPAQPTYTCSGTITPILGDDSTSPLATLVSVTDDGAPVTHDLTAGALLTANSINHLRFRFKLPTDCDNAVQGSSAVFTFTFDATQRAATNR